jgi:MFS transporter, OFA family, oxalate/formate antiporter
VSAKQSNRWMYVVVGVAIMLTFGMIYAWSVFVLPLEREFGWSREQTSLTFSITMTFFAAGIVVGGVLTDVKGPRLVLVIAGVLIGFGLAASSFTRSLVHLYVSYGVVCGLAVGIAYNCVISTVVRWFPDRRGAISGMLMMGFGIGGLVLGFGASHVIKAFGWRAAFQILAGVVAAVIVLLGCLLRPCETASPTPALADDLRTGDHRSRNWCSVMSDPLFWMVWFWQVSVISGGLATIGHVVPLAIENGFRNDQAAYALGAFSILNGIGRVGFGYLSDRLGRRQTMLADSLLMIVAMVLLAFGFSQEHYAGLLLSVMVAGLAYGGAMPQVSAAIAAIFGMKRFGANFGLVSTGIVAAAFFGPYLSGLSRAVTGNYSLGFVFLAGLASVGTILASRIGGRGEQYAQQCAT